MKEVGAFLAMVEQVISVLRATWKPVETVLKTLQIKALLFVFLSNSKEKKNIRIIVDTRVRTQRIDTH